MLGIVRAQIILGKIIRMWDPSGRYSELSGARNTRARWIGYRNLNTLFVIMEDV